MPKRSGLIGCVALLALLSVFGGFRLSAQEVSHHDHTVNLEDPKVCLECHDGTLAPCVVACTVNCMMNLPGEHPTFVPYPPQGEERYYESPATLKSLGIELFEGQVVCTSCHDLANQNKNHLVMENTGSRLCLACHRMLNVR